MNRPTIAELHAALDALAARQQRIAAEPSPWIAEGRVFETATECSYYRGQVLEQTLLDMDRVKALIDERCQQSRLQRIHRAVMAFVRDPVGAA